MAKSIAMVFVPHRHNGKDNGKQDDNLQWRLIKFECLYQHNIGEHDGDDML